MVPSLTTRATTTRPSITRFWKSWEAESVSISTVYMKVLQNTRKTEKYSLSMLRTSLHLLWALTMICMHCVSIAAVPLSMQKVPHWQTIKVQDWKFWQQETRPVTPVSWEKADTPMYSRVMQTEMVLQFQWWLHRPSVKATS